MATVPFTIAIPTYNRNATLKASLERLLPQLGANCQLLIVDNHSDVPVADTLAETLRPYPTLNCRVVRNRVNIGANANILRCFEHCDTDWAWVLGDDDAVKPDALAIVNHALEAHRDCLYINFAYDELRPQDFTTTGIREFAFRLDLSANLPWIASSLYKVSVIRKNSRFGYQYAYTMIPHVATLLTSLQEDGKCFFSKERVTRVTIPATHEQWSMLNLALGYPILFDLPMEMDVREQLIDKLLVTRQGRSPHLPAIYHELRRMMIDEKSPKNAFYYYDQVRVRSRRCEKDWKRRLSLRFLGVLMRFPPLFGLLYRMVKKKPYDNSAVAPDRFRRM